MYLQNVREQLLVKRTIVISINLTSQYQKPDNIKITQQSVISFQMFRILSNSLYKCPLISFFHS